MPDAAGSNRRTRILELRSVRGTGGGPEKTILAGAALADRARFDVTVCYIRDARDREFRIDSRAAQAEVDYVEVLERHSIDPGIWPALRRLVIERHIDLVHAHDYKTDVLALLLAKTTRAIPLSTAHGWTGHAWRERHLYYPLDRRALTRFPLVIAVSEQIRETLIASGARPDRVTTVLNGIDPESFRRDPTAVADARLRIGCDPDDIVIGGVGRLEPQKRFDLMIDACAALQSRWPRLRLVVAGDGSLRAQLEGHAAKALRPGTWRFLGQDDDVIAVHHGLNLFVQASDYEGTPNAVLEAMALGTPIVATSAGGTAQLVTDAETALVVPPGNVAALTAAIERALADPDAAARRAVAARRRVEEDLSFAGRVRRVETLYVSLIDRFGSRSNDRRGLQWA